MPRKAESVHAQVSGSVLILSLWAVVALSLFAISLAEGVRQRITVYRRLEERSKLRGLMENGMRRVIQNYRTIDTQNFLRPRDKILYLFSLRHGRYSNPDGDLVYEVTGEEERININTAGPEVLRTLFQTVANLGEEPSSRLAYAVIDYRDEDDAVTQIYQGGSEKGAYQQAGIASGPKNAPFELISELLLVQGMTREIYNSLLNYITIYGGGSLDINRAGQESMIAAQFEMTLIDKLLSYRKGIDGREGTGDDGIFEDAGSVEEQLPVSSPLTGTEINSLRHGAHFQPLTAQADCFRATGTARLSGGGSVGKVVCVFCQSSGVRYWNES